MSPPFFRNTSCFDDQWADEAQQLRKLLIAERAKREEMAALLVEAARVIEYSSRIANEKLLKRVWEALDG